MAYIEEAALPTAFILKLYEFNVSTTARDHHTSALSRAPTPANVPRCFWSCMDPPALCCMRPQIDAASVTLKQW
jgi:hypothetical protein